MNNVSLLIALRYFKSKRSGFVSIISWMAFSGIAIGVAVLIIVTSVMNGFESLVHDKLKGFEGDLRLTGDMGNISRSACFYFFEL